MSRLDGFVTCTAVEAVERSAPLGGFPMPTRWAFTFEAAGVDLTVVSGDADAYLPGRDYRLTVADAQVVES